MPIRRRVALLSLLLALATGAPAQAEAATDVRVMTGATVAGRTTITDHLAPGRYVVRLMKDDGYAELAHAAFRVRR